MEKIELSKKTYLNKLDEYSQTSNFEFEELNVLKFYDNLGLEKGKYHTKVMLNKAKIEALNFQDVFMYTGLCSEEKIKLNKKCIEIAHKFLTNKRFGFSAYNKLLEFFGDDLVLPRFDYYDVGLNERMNMMEDYVRILLINSINKSSQVESSNLDDFAGPVGHVGSQSLEEDKQKEEVKVVNTQDIQRGNKPVGMNK
jgi:hypothetical protein